MKIYKSLFLILGLFISSTVLSQKMDKRAQISFIQKEVQLSVKETAILYSVEDYAINLMYNFVKDYGKKGGLNKDFKYLIEVIEKEKPVVNYTKDNYPGKELGYPFEWWKDEKWIKENLMFKS